MVAENDVFKGVVLCTILANLVTMSLVRYPASVAEIDNVDVCERIPCPCYC